MTQPRFLTTALCLAIGSASSGAVYAQRAALEEVIVTAQKREQNLQDVGVSVTAYSGDPAAKFDVPSIGSTSHTEPDEVSASNVAGSNW